MSLNTKEILKVTQKRSKKLWDKLFGVVHTVESMDTVRNKAGVKYKVLQGGDGTWKCSCKSFIFDTGTKIVTFEDTGQTIDKTCKHIRYVMRQEELDYTAKWKR